VLDQVLKVIREDDDLHSSHVGGAELLGTDACEADFLPDLWNIGLFGSLKCSLILLQLYENLGKLVVISDLLIENASCLVESLVEAAVTTLLNVSLVRL
jgi:hypothetical protein